MKTDFKVGTVCTIISESKEILEALIISKFNEDLFGVFDTDRRFHQVNRCNMFRRRQEALMQGCSN